MLLVAVLFAGLVSVVAGSNMPNGKLMWNYTTGDAVTSSPAVVNGVVYVGSGDGNVYALNAAAATSQGATPGFEVAFAVVGLAVAAYVVSRRR
jgi:PGF-CTERM protein